MITFYHYYYTLILISPHILRMIPDFPGINCLFLVFPFAFHGKLTQYIGRIQRGLDINSKIYDYRDINIQYLEKFYKKRLSYYKKHFDYK